jgi:hypothetical protein
VKFFKNRKVRLIPGARNDGSFSRKLKKKVILGTVYESEKQKLSKVIAMFTNSFPLMLQKMKVFESKGVDRSVDSVRIYFFMNSLFSSTCLLYQHRQLSSWRLSACSTWRPRPNTSPSVAAVVVVTTVTPARGVLWCVIDHNKIIQEYILFSSHIYYNFLKLTSKYQ